MRGEPVARLRGKLLHRPRKQRRARGIARQRQPMSRIALQPTGPAWPVGKPAE